MPLEQTQTLLVHGGSHGAWCWAQVTQGLAEAGIDAMAFDLPGCGNDQTPRAGVNLDDSVAAMLATLDAMRPGPVRIVAHSIAGWLLPFAAAARPDRVSELVFVAAAVLDRGESGIGVTPAQRRPGYFELARSSPDNSLLVDFESAWVRFFSNLPERAAHAAYAKLTPQPFGPYLDKAAVGIAAVNTPRRFIALTQDRNYDAAATEQFARKAGVEREWLPGDHCVMLSDPSGLVGALR